VAPFSDFFNVAASRPVSSKRKGKSPRDLLSSYEREGQSGESFAHSELRPAGDDKITKCLNYRKGLSVKAGIFETKIAPIRRRS
jgi:hypothetical protein